MVTLIRGRSLTYWISLCFIQGISEVVQGQGSLRCPIGFCSVNDSCSVPMATLDCVNPEYCSGNGDCITYGKETNCICFANATGSRCQFPLPSNPFPCSVSSECRNGGSCVEGGSSRICVCTPGFHGDRCEVETLTVTFLNICRNGGTSFQYGFNIGCLCPCGFYGTFCESVWRQDMISHTIATVTELKHTSTVSYPESTAESNRDCDSQPHNPCVNYLCGPGARCSLNYFCNPTCKSTRGDNSVSQWIFILVAFGIICLAVASVCCISKCRRKSARDSTENTIDSPSVIFHDTEVTAGHQNEENSTFRTITSLLGPQDPPPYDDVSGLPPSYDEVVKNDSRDYVHYI